LTLAFAPRLIIQLSGGCQISVLRLRPKKHGVEPLSLNPKRFQSFRRMLIPRQRWLTYRDSSCWGPRMSLQSWLQNSWLVQHTRTAEEIKNLLAISDRDLSRLAKWNSCPPTGGVRSPTMRRSRQRPPLWLLPATGRTRQPCYPIAEVYDGTGRKFIDTLDAFRKKRNVAATM